MRMSKVTKYKILDLLEEITLFEKLVKLHEPENDSFMVDQYQARKTKLTKELIQLILPISDPHGFLFIKQFLNKHYSKRYYSKLAPSKKKTNAFLDFELLQKEMVR